MNARILFVVAVIVGCSDPRGDAPAAREVPEHERETPPPSLPPSPPPTPPPTTPEPPPAVDPGATAATVPAEVLTPPATDMTAPATYAVELTTSEGPIVIDVTRAWAPVGADRFYTLVQIGYFNDVAFFRVIDGFMAQTGIHGDPRVNAVWRDRSIPDDPRHQSNTRGMVSFATSGPNSRTTQFFINFGDNSNLDPMGFSPFGRVRDMAPVDRIHDGYGEGAPRGMGPAQARIQMQGNAYLRADFPELDYIQSARVL
jgi:peptidyl-prolyl cis-trans isomerase A (cyclophilin A)